MTDNQKNQNLNVSPDSGLQPSDDRQFYVSKIRQEYNSPTPGELPLIAVGSHENQEEFLELIKECGFHCFQSSFNPGENDFPSLKKYLDLSTRHGMKQILRLFGRQSTTLDCTGLTPGSDGELKNHLTETKTEDLDAVKQWDIFISSWKDLVKKFWNHEACAGYQIEDEFAITKIGWLSYVKDIIVENDPLQGMAFTGLLPEWAGLTGLAGGCKNNKYIPSTGKPELKDINYQAYLDEYQRMFKPAVWLYDGYYAYGGTYTPQPGQTFYRNSTFFSNLDLIRRKSIEDNRPFWTTVRCLYKNPLTYENKATSTSLNDICQIYQDDIPQEHAALLAK